MPAPVFYMGAVARGTGDGSSYANRAAWSWERYLGKLAEWAATPPPAAGDDPFFTTTYLDLNGVSQTTTGFPVVTGGTVNGEPESPTNPVVPGSYVADALVPHYQWVPASIAARVRLCVADGAVSWTGNPGATSTFSDAHHAPGGAGTAASPLRFFVTESDDPANPGQPIPDTPSVTETVSTTVAHKAGVAADWVNPANHSATTGWTGTTVDKAITWQVERPRTGFVFTGSRSPDPRTDAEKATQIRVTYRDNQMVYDPASTSGNPVFVRTDGSNQPYVLNRGERFDMTTKTILPSQGDALGNFWNRTPPSYHVFRGIEWRNFAAPFDYAANRPVRFIHYRAVKTDNTRYFNARGASVTDVWAERMENRGWSAKCHTPETNCHRWLFRHVWQRGHFTSGDHIKAGFQSSQPWDAGPLIIEHMFGDCYWDSNTVTRNTSGQVTNHGQEYGGTSRAYPQGEGVDYEGSNLVLRRVKFDLCLDGAIDTKPRTRWIGYYRLFTDLLIASRTRRALRLWFPSGTYDDAQNRYNAAYLRNTTVVDARDRALHTPTEAPSHNVGIWRNDSGQAMTDRNRQFPTGLTYYFRLNEQDDGAGGNGNATFTLYQPLDLRPAGSPALRHRGTDERPLPSVSPWRQLTRVTTTAPPTSPVQLLAKGTAHNPDRPAAVAGPVTLTAPAAGVWRVHGGGGTLAVAVDAKSAEYTPGA